MDRQGFRNRVVAAVGACVLLSLAFGGFPSAASGQEGAAPAKRTVTCSFSNPGYSGWCRQSADVPAGTTSGKVCADILRCLNDVRCTATYCSATEIRGNWKIAKVESRPAKR